MGDPAELDENERIAFLEWRRELVDVEKNENLVLTPFEKNLEVWRQLWRVVERSNVLVQIVDSRNPMLFYSSDLVRYVHEVDPNKKNILLLNKADLLTRKQRKYWAEHFRAKNIKFIFFSAYNEHVALEEEQLAARAEAGKEEQSVKKPKLAPREELPDDAADSDPDIAIMNSEDLIQYLMSFAGEATAQKRLVVGMVGYPNVGKSSTINVLCKQKKVAESATPGKTKHFQTIILNEQLCLCDCPGLVFPSYIATKADMVCNGLLPIDQMRDHVGPVGLVCLRIPRRVFEQLYGFTLPAPSDFEDPNRPPTPHELMQTYGRARGFMASHGQPDEPRSARYILKDYVMGRLLYAHPPVGEDPHEFNSENYANVPMSKQHLSDTISGTLEQMQSKSAPKTQDQIYKGKRKVRRRHQGEGQETVMMKTKGVRSVPYGQKLPTNIRL